MARIAVVSVAHIHARGFLETLREVDGPPCAIWDSDAARGRAYATDCPFVGDLDELLADDSIEGFLVCAENTRHLPLLEQVLPLGRPTLCEKPLATTAADARRIGELLAASGAPLTSGYFQPFNPQVRGVMGLLASGALGKLTHVSFRNAHHAAYGRWFDDAALRWFTDPALAGGGALMDMGTHAVHCLRTLCGEVTRVWATVANLCGAYPEVDDWGTVQLEFASGVRGRVEAAWVQTGGPRGLELVGSAGAVWQAPDGGYVTGAPGRDPVPVAPGDAVPDRVKRLLALVAGEVPEADWRADLAACLDSVAIMDAAYRSAETGAWVDVEPIA